MGKFKNWLLQEAMNTEANLPEGAFVNLTEHPYFGTQFVITDQNGERIPKMGFIGFKQSDRPGIYSVSMVTAQGWGPFLYDLAIEHVTQNGGAMARDLTVSTTPEAARVWDFYFHKRNDVQHQALPKDLWIDDNPQNPLNYSYSKSPPVRLEALKRTNKLLQI